MRVGFRHVGCVSVLQKSAVNFGLLLDAGDLIVVTGYVLVHCRYDETEALYSKPPAIVLTRDTGF